LLRANLALKEQHKPNFFKCLLVRPLQGKNNVFNRNQMLRRSGLQLATLLPRLQRYSAFNPTWHLLITPRLSGMTFWSELITGSQETQLTAHFSSRPFHFVPTYVFSRIMIYSRFASFYDSFMAPLESLFLHRWRSETTALLPVNQNVLEIGAGTGLNFEHYPKCEIAIASEYSRQMLVRAVSRTNTIELLQTDAQMLPFPDDSFDAAFATLVFCGLPDPLAAFDQLKRVVRKNGTIVLLEHVRPKGILGYFFDVLNLFTVALIDDHFNRNTAGLAKSAGLHVTEVRSKAFGIVNLIVCRNILDESESQTRS
jgi:ubiquinone/menaquinone biosynthesis C-methylase UbiE